MALSSQRKQQLARAAGRQLARFIRLVLKTSDVVMVPENGQQLVLDDYPPIIAVWHGQFMMVATLQPEGFEADAIVARHGDAEVIAEALLPFNVRLVRGAGSQGRKFKKERGGVSALRQAVRTLKGNRAVVITADVPPGPARIAGTGVVTLAKLSGRPIIPVAVATSRFKSFNTWSRMTINLPYSKMVCVVGDKIWIPKDVSSEDLETKRQQLERALNEATEQAYRTAGADPMAATPASAVRVGAPLPAPGAKLKLYRGAMRAFRPLAPLLFAYRARLGKEDTSRLNERYGVASKSRPKGAADLVWVHAASVGETNAVLPVVDRLLSARPDLHVVLTTGTVTSATMVGPRLDPRVVHQYVPLDSPALVGRFLDHWKPNLAIFTESEIWPNLIIETSAREIPLALVNSRMSKKSHSRWRKNRGLSLPLFSRFSVVLAQNGQMARRFADLGARNVVTAGNLKVDAPAPGFDQSELRAFQGALRDRIVFVAASTHDGEEAQIIAAHRLARQSIENLCTIIVPRHPERGTAISELVERQGLRVAQRSLDQYPQPETDIFIADSIGELGLFYALTDLAFIGGSLISHGGQNPLEAVRLKTAVLSGPSQHNFADIYRALRNAGALSEVEGPEGLAAAVNELCTDRGELDRRITSALKAADSLGGALDLTVHELLKWLGKRETEHSRAAE